MAHLAYSNTFVNKLIEDSQRKDSNWIDAGYINAVRKAHGFKKGKSASWMKLFNVEALAYVKAFWNLTVEDDNEWYQYVSNRVHGPMNINADLKGKYLNSPSQRLGWAKSKDLVIAAALPTGTAVLHTNKGLIKRNQYFSVEREQENKKKKRYRTFRNFIPMSFSGPAAGRKRAPLFLTGNQNLIFSGHDTKKDKTLKLAANTPQRISVFDATAASSAALAIGCSEESWKEMLPSLPTAQPIAYALADYAPIMKFRNDGITIHSSTGRKNYKRFQREKTTRVADGAYTDNLSIAHQLRHMKENGHLGTGRNDRFQLVVFANSSSENIDYLNVDMNTGLAANFGHNGLTNKQRKSGDYPERKNHSYFETGIYPVQIPTPHVFNASAWNDTAKVVLYEQEWKDSKTKQTLKLSIFNLDVTTVKNEAYNIPAGAKGNLTVFQIYQSTEAVTAAMPLNLEVISLYQHAFETIRNSAVPNKTVLQALEQALGL